MFRIDIYWGLSISSFIIIASSKNVCHRIIAVETLGNFIIQAF